MRRFQALLIAASLAAAPASALAGPAPAETSTQPPIAEKLEHSAPKGRLGVMVMSLTPELRTHFGATGDRGVLVARVEPGTPAAAAGLKVGDVLVAVRGQPVSAALDVVSALAAVPNGQAVPIEILRDGKPKSIQATLSQPAASLFDSQSWFRRWLKPFET